jgi:Transglutaminase-like superfamily
VPLAAAACALAMLASGAGAARVPEGDVRYRVELAGVHVGWARLAVRCRPDSCDATWESALAAPDPGSGEASHKWFTLRVEPSGAARAVEVRVAADGRTRRAHMDRGPAPASLAEALLGLAEGGERRCVTVRDEETSREGEACARRDGAWLAGDVLGEPVRFRAERGALPREVLLPAQGARFVEDGRAALPRDPPLLFGSAAVAGPSGRTPSRFCGRALDPAPPPAQAGLAPPVADGETCRERTARYLEHVRATGGRGRTAVGVAHDGRGFVWHAWAEVWDGARWVPVDPSFGEAPARGPRFTVARYDDRDAAARAAAGRAILVCWGRAQVE